MTPTDMNPRSCDMDSEQPRNNEEAAGALIEAFRRANLERPPDFTEECSMTDIVMAYALNEAEPQECAEIKKHLITCRACVDLYFDVRMTKKWAEESSQQPVPMSAELQTAIQKSSASDSDSFSIFQKIGADVSRYFSFLTTPQGLSAVAASLVMVCLALYYSLDMHGPLTANITMTAKPMTVRSATSQAAPYQINAGDTLKTGEQFQVTITTNKDGYGYVILALPGVLKRFTAVS